jgi:hypothetical protein
MTLEASAFTSIQERHLAAARGEGVQPRGLVPFMDHAVQGGDPLALSFTEYVDVLPKKDAGEEDSLGGEESCPDCRRVWSRSHAFC